MRDACSAQVYWYWDGKQQARFCGKDAVTSVRSMDGSTWKACEEHAGHAFDAGATLFNPVIS